MQKLKEHKTGQALVEFSLILVVLLMIIFVIIEGGRLFQGWVTVQNAAREGARYAITGQYDPACLVDVPACPDPRVQSIKDVATTASTGLSIDPTAGFDEPRYHEVEVFGINEYDAWQEDYAGNAGKTVLVRVIYRMPVITPMLRPIAESVPVVGQVTLNNENFVQVNNSKADNTPPDLPPPPTPGPPVADLQIEKSASPPVVLINEPIDYLLRITNFGPKGAKGIVVEDTLPSGVTFVSASPIGICTHAAGVVTCNPPDIPRGAIYDINIRVSAPSSPPPSPGEITNEATVTGAAIDDDPSNNSDSVNTLVVLDHTVADLELVSKDDLPDPVVVNQQLNYTIVVRNNGVNDATAVTVMDTLPAGLTYLSSSPGCIYSSGTVACALGDLAVGATASVDIQTTAPSSTGLIVNTATVSANEADPNLSNNSLTESTTISPEWTDLFVTKMDSPDPAPVGQNLLYSIQVGNNGPGDATNVTITDVLPNSVTLVSATPTQGSCNPPGNPVVCNLGTILATNLANINVVVKPNNTGTISNQVTVSGDQADPNTVNDSSTATTTIAPTADLSITKSATPPSPPGAVAGEILSYHIVATNNGPSPATNVQVIDALPIDVSFLSVTTNHGSCLRTGATITCNLGNMAVGATVDIDIRVIPQQEGVINNSASVTGSQYDPNPVDNTARDTTTVGEPITAFITLDPVCGDAGSSLVVNGFNWPSNGNKDVVIYWDVEAVGNQIGVVPKNGTVWSRTVSVPAGVTDGVYSILAKRQNVLVSADFTIPCPAPNLITTQPSLISPSPVKAGDPVSFEVDISNIGDLDAISQFFVGLYFDPPAPPDPTTTHLPQNYRAELVAVSGLAVGASQTVSMTADNGFDLPGTHDVYVVVDSDPGPMGIIDERDETDNISPVLQLDIEAGTVITPPGGTITPTATPGTPGSLIGQAFLTTSGGQTLPQAGVEVRVYESVSGALTGITYTDTEGSYFFTAMNPEDYTISACIIIDAKSYSYTVTGVSVLAGLVTIEDLYLEAGTCS